MSRILHIGLAQHGRKCQAARRDRNPDTGQCFPIYGPRTPCGPQGYIRDPCRCLPNVYFIEQHVVNFLPQTSTLSRFIQTAIPLSQISHVQMLKIVMPVRN
jgi:hypothetical protein